MIDTMIVRDKAISNDPHKSNFNDSKDPMPKPIPSATESNEKDQSYPEAPSAVELEERKDRALRKKQELEELILSEIRRGEPLEDLVDMRDSLLEQSNKVFKKKKINNHKQNAWFFLMHWVKNLFKGHVDCFLCCRGSW